MNQQQKTIRLPEQNSVIIVGRLTKDPDLRRTSTGKAVCIFDIAFSRRVKDSVTGEWKDSDTTFVPIVVWGEQAERCNDRLKKGFSVYIEGRLRMNKWDGPNGTKRSRLEVIVSRIQFLSVIKNINSEIEQVSDTTDNSNIDEQNDQNIDIDDEDIPF
ncbi:MAG: single-stranded DNA-binding protein [Endomicrobium sp.]|jgi:single-strand DNA-binding protein|nr:single-stranded DNA-binding protein [Endomicrobium sp.]